MSDYPLAKYSAKIKDVYIELKNYEFFHSPYDETSTKIRFIGREKIKNRIVSILKNTNVKSGSYLITGFRGMGKTSVVREALDEFNNNQIDDTSKIIKGSLDSWFSELMKAVRILIFCYATYLILQYFFSDLFTFNKIKFLIQSCILFSIIFSIGFLLKSIISNWDSIKSRLKSIWDSSNSSRNQSKHQTHSNKICLTIYFILISVLPTTIFIVFYFSYFEGWGEFLYKFKLNIFSLSPRFSLLFAFSIIAIITFISTNLFSAIWDFFRIAFIVLLLLISTIFLFDYSYICSKGACGNSVTGFMDKFFPVVSFQKNPAPNNAIGNFNSNFDMKVSSSNTNTNFNESVKVEPIKETEADVITIVFRLVISILFSYIILSLIVFLVDLIFLLKVGFLQLINAEKSKKYVRFEINLSQDGLDEMEILRRMAIEIENDWQGRKFDLGSNLFNRKFYFPWRYIIKKVDRPRKIQFEPSYNSVSGKLNLLKNRMSGNLTTRRERKTPPNITTPIANLIEIEMPLGNYTNNDEISYPIASVKEAEDQLKQILEDIDTLRNPEKKLNIPQFVFIIDELDKIDPHNSSVIQERESSNPVLDSSIYAEDTNRFRQRREAVGKLLANLKGFLNVAKAKFFFIGGREMFDADLADIADRESFYSSIFNDVIYVESFYKDSIGKDSQSGGGITQMTETYICNVILNDLGGSEIKKKSNNKVKNGNNIPFEPDKLNLKQLYNLLRREKGNPWLEFNTNLNEVGGNLPQNLSQDERNSKTDELSRQKYKIISTLQNYIVYLTYRSSGTPKKLNGLVEHLIVKGPKLDPDIDNNKQRFFEENVVVLHTPPEENDDFANRLFLKFNFNTQYELGLTSNLYRPYLIANSRHMKSLGDKLLFSSSFIIDHILKFHPFGFSWRNLELIPEVVLVNREPNLREFIEELMRFYSLNYIRDTVSGIFDYRFRSIIRRELVHLSKTSDLSAAAFNFTLDESLATKRHYKRKIIELREKYKGYQPIEGGNQFIHSLYFVQTIVGDLHFYDKEYDDAILYYTESIQTLRLPNAITDRKITRHQFLLWVKNKLKLGLTLEKIRAFDSAFSIYKTLILDSERYFKNIVSKETLESKKKNEIVDKNGNEIVDKNDHLLEAEDHRAIHLICMPFVALLAVTEKLRNDGLSYTNLFSNRKDFLRTINYPKDGESKNDQEFDKYRKFYLMGDYYNNVGSILYFKNCQFTRFFKEPDYFLEVFDGKKEEYPLISQQNKIYNTEGKPYDFFPSLTSFNYYWNSLYFLLKYHQDRLVEKIEKKLTDEAIFSKPVKSLLLLPPAPDQEVSLKDNLLALCTAYLLPDCVDMVNSNRLYYIANVVSKIGDSILASLNEDGFIIPDKEFEALDISAWGKETDKKREENIKWFMANLGHNLFTAETVLYTYKLAAALYKRAGYSSYYASHLTKILYVIKDLIEINKNKEEQKNKIKAFLAIDKTDERPFEKLEEIAETVFRATTWNNEVSNRPQILKYREIFDISIKGNKDRELIYNIINNISDSKEVVVLVESIKIKLGKYIKSKDFIENHFTLGKTITSAYGSMSNRYQRMLELKYRTERCYYIVNNILELGALFDKELEFKAGKDNNTTGNDKGKTNKEIIEQIRKIIEESTENEKDVTINDVVAFLIQEALFSSSQLIKMIKLYNPGYVIGFSFIAEAHSRMGDWCQAYDNYLKIIDEDILSKDTNIYKKHLNFLRDKQKFLKQNTTFKSINESRKHFEEYDKNYAKIHSWTQNEESLKTIESKTSEVINKEIEEKVKQITKVEINELVIEKYGSNFNNSNIEKNSYTYNIIKNCLNKNSKIKTLKKDEFSILGRKFIERIKELLGGEGLIYLESKNHYETAVQYYYKMIQLHSDGKTYKEKLHEIYMLEDDYNDNIAHYTIAAERVRINTGKIKEKINYLNNKIKDSKVYEYNSYLTSDNEILDGLDIETINEYLDYFATVIIGKKE